MIFDNRKDAGRRLAEVLARFRDDDPVVLALPRGGVPVAFEIARALAAPLDVALVRKIGLPWQPELALGAVVGGERPELVVNEQVRQAMPLPEGWLEQESRRQLAEIDRRRRLYFGDRPPLALRGRTVLVVDDGIATGATMRAVLRALRRQEPRRLVLAVPVAAPDSLRGLEAECDEAVCLYAPLGFQAVGLYYRDFGQTGDDEVIALLRRAADLAADGEAEVERRVRAALLADPRIDLARHPLRISCSGGIVTLEGELGTVAARRQAAAIAAAVPGVRSVADRLHLRPSRRLGDPELLDRLRDALFHEPGLAAYTLRLMGATRAQLVRRPDQARGLIVFSVSDGVVTLEGETETLRDRHLAGLAAWGVQGCRDVLNHMTVKSPEPDRDAEMAEAVRLALQKDPELHPDRLQVSSRGGVVFLRGQVPSPRERACAENDAWFIDGVSGVENGIEV